MRHVLTCLLACLTAACLESPPPADAPREVSTVDDDAIRAPAEEIDPGFLAELELASTSKKCVVKDRECVCPEPPAGMRVKDTLCEVRVLGCGRQGFCTYVYDRTDATDIVAADAETAE